MDTKKLKEVLAIQTYSNKEDRMIFYIESELDKLKIPYTSDLAGNIYVTKGKSHIYPCVVAHMDTVHLITSDLTVLEIEGKLTGFNTILMEQTGIGGDDKVGIFIALACLKKFDKLKAVFFVNEEQGCIGSYDANMKFFDDCSFVLQCDRQGSEDFINTASGVPLSSVEFQDAIKPILTEHGYKFHYGMMTDVMALKENGLPVSCANMSCGYYHPHSYREYVDIYDVFNCLNMVEEIIEKFGTTKKYKHAYHYEAPKKSFISSWWNSKTKKWEDKKEDTVYAEQWKKWNDQKYPTQTKSIDTWVEENSKKYNKQKYPNDTTGAKLCEWCGEGEAENNGFCKKCNGKYDRRDVTPKLCQDCWQNEAEKNGLCKECNAYYKQEEDIAMGIYDYDSSGNYVINGGFDKDGIDRDGLDKDGYPY